MSDGKSENLKKAEDTNSSSIETIYELIKSGKLEEAKKYIAKFGDPNEQKSAEEAENVNNITK